MRQTVEEILLIGWLKPQVQTPLTLLPQALTEQESEQRSIIDSPSTRTSLQYQQFNCILPDNILDRPRCPQPPSPVSPLDSVITFPWMAYKQTMGICYSSQQQWTSYEGNRRHKKTRKAKSKVTSSVIYEQKSCCGSSFVSNMEESFRDDIYETLSHIAVENGSVAFGSVVEISAQSLRALQQSLDKINLLGEPHSLNDPLTLSNLKTKNCLHTHRIKIPECSKSHEVSCCPFNSNHMIEYDIWKLVAVEKSAKPAPEDPEYKLDEATGTSEESEPDQEFYIYHPFTQKFLALIKGTVVCSEFKMRWSVHSFGKRRNGGFMKIYCDSGELCMGAGKGLLSKHRNITICKEKHISHLWEITCSQLI